MDGRFPSIVEKSIIIFNHLHVTSNDSSATDQSRIQIQFQAILLNLDDDENSLRSGKDYYITAGVEYGELLMVRQAMISTATVLIPNVRFNSSLFTVHRQITIFYLFRITNPTSCFTPHPSTRELRKATLSSSGWKRTSRHRLRISSSESCNQWDTT